MRLLIDHPLPPFAPQGNNADNAFDVSDLSPQGAAYVRAHQDFFDWLAQGSPYLAGLVRRYPDVLDALHSQNPEDYCHALLAALDGTGEDQEAWMAQLRATRNRISLTTGLCDIAGFWDVEQVMGMMTALADKAVASTLRFLLGTFLLDDETPSGLVVLALGKHGGGELNYSSDIDIVIYYTPDAMPLPPESDERKFYITLVRDLTHILQHRTADGYVFRVDLRLRPDPGATQIALSVPAALSYYESMGQNWERAVYIKARPIAGDIAAGEKFIADLSPYIWRRYFDFSALEDVHSMKRQIHAVHGSAAIATAGHNIKLGRGGIREIEFFVQTQQLIAGGRDSGLRGRRTIDMLEALAARDWIGKDAASGLTTSYYFLRNVEHRLQMQQDEQTHTLPESAADFTAFAHFMGYEDGAAFAAILVQHLTYVTQEYGHLFEKSESLSATSGSLVFTGHDHDPATIATLREMGFARPHEVSDMIRGWHAGRLRATRTTRSREILTRLMPHLLQSLARAADPDDAFIKLNGFLEKLPAAVQFFSLVQSQSALLDVLVNILTIAPYLAERLSGNAALMDVLLENRLPSERQVVAPLVLPADAPQDFQNVLDSVRVHVHEAQFAAAIQMMNDAHTAHRQARYFTDLAEGSLRVLLSAALKDMERQYGTIGINNGASNIAIVGMGKLGSRELSLQSDLDLIIMCDCPDFTAESSGGSSTPISADLWFARAARRILNGLTAATAAGELYAVDTRLRPSGNAGPLVSKFVSFQSYQENEAWGWEHLALTRARTIAATGDFATRLDGFIAAFLCRPRDVAKLAHDVQDMRARLTTHQPPQHALDVRRGAGGLRELEFICQSLQLAHAAHHAALARPLPLAQALEALHDAACLSADTHDALLEAAQCYSVVRQCTALIGDDVLPQGASLGLLLQATDMPDAPRLIGAIAAHRAHVAATLDTILHDWA